VKLAAYTRVSTIGQVREGYGLDAQRADIRAWAKSDHHRIMLWCSDEGISGANGVDTRHGLYEALQAVQDGRVQGIVFTSLDRLARKMTEQEGVLAEVWRAGGHVFSLGDGGEILEDDPDDPMRTAIRQMRGVFAQLERGLIRQRMAKGRREKKAQGGYVAGSPRFGMKAHDKALVLHEVEAAVVARINELREEGLSLRAIVRQLGADGVPSKRGARWHPTTVARLLAR
jgi:DNA invertase Pin-like site-specific DNA recombinase